MNRTKLAVILVVIILATLVFRYALLGSGSLVTLSSAPALTGAVSQSMGTAGGSSALMVGGKDFVLKNVQYFDNNTWAVASIEPLKNQFDPSIVILQQKNGVFQVVLGPGTAFDDSFAQSLPSDLGNYLSGRGVFYATN